MNEISPLYQVLGFFSLVVGISVLVALIISKIIHDKTKIENPEVNKSLRTHIKPIKINMEKIKIVAELLKEMEIKYPLTKYEIKEQTSITIEYDKNDSSIVIYKFTPIDFEPGVWEELERIKIE